MAELTIITYAPLTQIQSNNLNETQAEAVNMPIRIVAADGRQFGVGAFSPAGSWVSANAADILVMDMTLKPGTRLPTFRARVEGVLALTVAMSVARVTDGVAGAPIATSFSAGAGLQDLVIAGLTEDMPELGASLGVMYQVAFTVTGIGLKVHTLEWATAIIP